MGQHHTLLWLGLAGLALWVFLPWSVALLIWGLMAIASALALAHAVASTRVPVATGREAMQGAYVHVLGRVGAGWQVRHLGEVWSALSPDELEPGKTARIVGFEGLKLVVLREHPGASPARRALDDAHRVAAGALARLEWHITALDAEAGRREAAARRVLASNEDIARQYLAQRRVLLTMRANLATEADALRANLDRIEALAAKLPP